MLLTHEQKCKELSQAVEHMSERQEQLVAMMERIKILGRISLADLSRNQEIRGKTFRRRNGIV